MRPAPPARATPHRRGRPRLPRHRDAGSASIELVMLMPLLFAFLFAGVQGAVLYHGRAVAIAAAEEGARAAAAQHATPADGQAAAVAFAAADLGALDVTVRRGPASATATVTGTTLSLIPGWKPTISQSASAPLERLTT